MEIGIEPEIIDIAVKKLIAIELVAAYTRTPKTLPQIENSSESNDLCQQRLSEILTAIRHCFLITRDP
jgi:hypothetical protein